MDAGAMQDAATDAADGPAIDDGQRAISVHGAAIGVVAESAAVRWTGRSRAELGR
jgi:hypothetical protein